MSIDAMLKHSRKQLNQRQRKPFSKHAGETMKPTVTTQAEMPTIQHFTLNSLRNSSMKNSIYIYGPVGCGKTWNSQRLCAHYGLSFIIDDYYPEPRVKVPKTGALIIGGLKDYAPAGIVAISFDQAMQDVGRHDRDRAEVR